MDNNRENDVYMDMRIELIFVPVTDVDRAKSFYVDKVGFHADHDQRVSPELRFVQLTPPGSACSIAFGEGLIDMEPGSQRGIQIVTSDLRAFREHLVANGVEATEVVDEGWGQFTYFSDPDGNAWSVQQLPDRS